MQEPAAIGGDAAGASKSALCSARSLHGRHPREESRGALAAAGAASFSSFRKLRGNCREQQAFPGIMAEHQGGSAEPSLEAAQPLLSDLESQQLWGSVPSLDVSGQPKALHMVLWDPASWRLHLLLPAMQPVSTCRPLVWSLPSHAAFPIPLLLCNRRWRGRCRSHATCRAC